MRRERERSGEKQKNKERDMQEEEYEEEERDVGVAPASGGGYRSEWSRTILDPAGSACGHIEVILFLFLLLFVVRCIIRFDS